MTTDRNKLIDKIKKLRTKGENGGVTEEEAHAFLAAAAKLMAEHHVSDADLAKAGIGVEPIEKKGVHTSIHKMHPACLTLKEIGYLTGTSIGMRVTSERSKCGYREIGALTISGRPQDREIADYLYDQIRNLIDGAWAAERKARIEKATAILRRNGAFGDIRESDPWLRRVMTEAGVGVGHKERRSFGFGMAFRLAERLESMAMRHGDSRNALVVWRETCHKTEQQKKKKLNLDQFAFSAGSRVGASADLGQGVASGQIDVKRLG